MYHIPTQKSPGSGRDRWKERAELALRWATFVFTVLKFLVEKM